MSAQAKPISEVVKDFEQSLGNLRPSTKRVYVAGARAAIRAASLELWQSPSLSDLLAAIGKSPAEKSARISPFLDFLVRLNNWWVKMTGLLAGYEAGSQVFLRVKNFKSLRQVASYAI